MKTEKRDIHQEVTDKLIAMMEAGRLPWVCPWKHGTSNLDSLIPYNALSRRNYNGINIMLLWGDSIEYGTNGWLTFNQCKQLGGTVKKGEKGRMIVFFKPFEGKDKVTGEKKMFPLLRHSHVFNVAQCEGLKLPAPRAVVAPVSPKGAVLEIATAHNVALSHGGNSAYFRPSNDTVQMPHFDQFKTEEGYSQTLAHELTHWTGHKSRLDRDLSGMKGLNHESYAKEELIAELGSAFLCAELGIKADHDQSAAYLQSWLQGLRNDKRYIFSAASAARKATDFLQMRTKEQEEQAADETLAADQEPSSSEKMAETLALLA